MTLTKMLKVLNQVQNNARWTCDGKTVKLSVQDFQKVLDVLGAIRAEHTIKSKKHPEMIAALEGADAPDDFVMIELNDGWYVYINGNTITRLGPFENQEIAFHAATSVYTDLQPK